MARRSAAPLALCAAILMVLTQAPAAARPMLVGSSNTNGVQGNGTSQGAGAGMDAIVFESDADNLVGIATAAASTESTPGLGDIPGMLLPDTNGVSDIFLHEVQTGRTMRVSIPRPTHVPVLGSEANGASRNPSVSADGQLIAFESDASNLVPDDDNGVTDVFVFNRRTGVTEIISAIGSTLGNGPSRAPSISADGRWVAFETDATNISLFDTNGFTDILARETFLSTSMVRVSKAFDGSGSNGPSFAPSMSGDGLPSVAFQSDASNLVPSDMNGTTDVFHHVLDFRLTRLASISSDGRPGDGPSRAPSITADGLAIAFESDASTLDPTDTNGVTDIFVRSVADGVTRRITGGGTLGPMDMHGSHAASIAPSGHGVAFVSASPMVPVDLNMLPDVYFAPLPSGPIELISQARHQQPANGPNFAPAVGSGGLIAFASDATNLIPRDANERRDVFATCAPETGPLSNAAHDLEPALGPAEDIVHRVSCATLAPLGL